jgi:predicted permease
MSLRTRLQAWVRRRFEPFFDGADRTRGDKRVARRFAWVAELPGDASFALRGLRRNPAFTTVALLTLALGIGANAAMFSIVNGILLRPLPYPAPEQLVLLHQANVRTGDMHGRVSFEDLEDWRTRARTLTSVAGFAAVPTILTGRGEATEISKAYVTDAFFDVLGVPVLLGRPLLEDDYRLRLPNAVISERLWRNELGGASDVLGSTMLLRGEPYTIVGVMPASVRHPTPETQVWVPQALVGDNMFSTGPPTRNDRYLEAVGRLAVGADAARAQQELSAVSAELATTYPESNADWSAALVVPLHESITGNIDQALLIVLGIVGFILLIGCANLANLLLARGSARSREIAVRASLGAGRGRLVRQLLTESLVLALIGGMLGLLLSYWGVQTILALSADTLPRVEDVRLDGRAVTFAIMLAGATGVLFGLVPALRLARVDPQHDLRGGRGTVGSDGRRLRSALVVAEVALAVLLVIGAGLMARSFMALRSVDPGFDPDRVLTVSLQINFAGVPDSEIAPFIIQRREEILRRVRELPAVTDAGMINVFPLRHDGAFSMEYTRTDRPPDETGVIADTRYIDPAYLTTMRIPLLRGEPLPEHGTPGAPTPVVMSESAARRLWPDGDDVGRMIRVPWGEAVVVGVVGDVRQIGLAEPPQPATYFPQSNAPRLLATLVARTDTDPLALAGPIRRVIGEIDANQPIRAVAPLSSVMAESIAQERFFALLFALFGSLALGLAAVGIYGVLAYSVRQRTQEIGVRMALGAHATDVLRMVAGSGMALVGTGVVIGTLAALGLSRLLASQLYGVAPNDPVSFIASIGFLCAVALIATWIPAWRATRVAPMTALRPE